MVDDNKVNDCLGRALVDSPKKNQFSLDQIISHSIEEVEHLLFAPESGSVFEDYEDFKILIIRRIQIQQQALVFASEAFVFTEKTVFGLLPGTVFFEKLSDGFRGMSRKLEAFYHSNQKVLSGYSDEIEKLEERLFERQAPRYFIDLWFGLKRDLSKIENFYFRNAIVYREFLKRSGHFLGDLLDDFADIQDLIQFHSSSINTLKGRLDSLHHYYDSVESGHLNKTILTLTIISGVFLPLNLIVGFFGMNTGGLYFQHDVRGTWNVILILLGVVAACLMGLKLVRLVDHYVMRFILGRYEFYQNISRSIKAIEDQFKVR